MFATDNVGRLDNHFFLLVALAFLLLPLLVAVFSVCKRFVRNWEVTGFLIARALRFFPVVEPLPLAGVSLVVLSFVKNPS